jgi:hypothetical protein
MTLNGVNLVGLDRGIHRISGGNTLKRRGHMEQYSGRLEIGPIVEPLDHQSWVSSTKVVSATNLTEYSADAPIKPPAE